MSDRTARARTVMVVQTGQAVQGVVSTVVVSIRPDAGSERLRVAGCVAFDPATLDHVRTVIVPLVDRVLEDLGVGPKNYDLSVMNLAAASVAGVPLRLTGHSADVPIFLSILSAALGMPIREDTVATGHIASPDGDIVMVRDMPAKVAAVLAEPSIHYLIHPSLEGDASLASLTPLEKERAEEALLAARGKIRTIAVRDVAELLARTCDEESVVLASLREGFFDASGMDEMMSHPAGRTVRFLAEDNESRFWNSLERRLLAGENQPARTLLLERARYHIRRKSYPSDLGRHLLQQVLSLPPAIRRVKKLFPLLPKKEYIALAQIASEQDFEDLDLLHQAVTGKGIRRDNAGVGDAGAKDSGPNRSDVNSAALQSVLSAIGEKALSEKIGQPIDAARAGYILDSVLSQSAEDFNDTVSAFYLHLLRHTRSVEVNASPDDVAADALALLERAFQKRGGYQGALAEGTSGIRGGMRLVLDALTEQSKLEAYEKEVNRVLKEAIDPLDWDAKVAAMRALWQRLSPHLPPEIQSEPPERFTGYLETIVRTYVNSMDSFASLIRTL